MVDLIWDQAPGETCVEKAIWLAAKRKKSEYLCKLLRDPDFDLSFIDRVLIAQFLEGDYRNAPGNRPADERIGILDARAPTGAQLAAQYVRDEMARLRAMPGARIRGQRDQLISIAAERFGARPETIANHLSKGR